MTVGEVEKIFHNNLLIAQKHKHIRKPFSFALYHTWKEVDRLEIERKQV